VRKFWQGNKINAQATKPSLTLSNIYESVRAPSHVPSMFRSSCRNKHLILTATFLFSCLLLRQTHSAEAQLVSLGPADFNSTQQGSFQLSGTVVNSASGEPIPHALVQVYSKAALTDSNGQFEFSGLPPMQATIVVRKPGFFNEQEVSRMPRLNGPELVKVGPDTPPVTLKLVPEGVVFGQVEGGGEPVENIPIKVFWSNINEGHRNWQRRDTVTDEDGSFRVGNLLPGTYYVAVGPSLDPNAMAMAGSDAEVGYPATYYPGVTEISEASPITLTPGQQAQVSFSLKKMRAFKLSGLVTGIGPDTGVNLEFKDHSGDNFYFPMQFNSHTGKFSIRVPAGSYVIHARAQNSDGVSFSAALPVTSTPIALALNSFLSHCL
jgi:hypothetical protein